MRRILLGYLGVAALAAATSQRQIVLDQVLARPNDAWLRGTGHVVLAFPGSLESEKSYIEPGGSFSPSVASFGVSFWSGNQSSDSIPLEAIEQRFVWPGAKAVPVLATKTTYYTADWELPRPGASRLRLHSFKQPVSIVIRSAGPAGAPLISLTWSGRNLLVNDRWTVTPSMAAALRSMGEETGGWMTDKVTRAHFVSASGWGYARFDVPPNSEATVLIADARASATNPLQTGGVKSGLELQLPDARFAASLDAQAAHLLMGLVKRETRPGDPTNYPAACLRDGAYTVVALARAGRMDVARQLIPYFAEHDFFGGFGHEADAPGLALWAMEEIAGRAHDPGLDHALWPHVQRKEQIILDMLSFKEAIFEPVLGPAVDTAAKHSPRYINAVSYRGLLDGAALARRLNASALEKQWTDAAAKLQTAWFAAYRAPEPDDDRTFISALWPSGIASQLPNAIHSDLNRRWVAKRNMNGTLLKKPLWTYFDVAEAHQWLMLWQIERVWTTIDWFWANQASPGLYSWWEGNGEENKFHRWEAVRGWVKPPNVTPHYWTAAEMLALQIDMLAYVEEIAGQPVLVVGAGIPKAWTTHEMSVRGIVTKFGTVDWTWTGKITVTQHGAQLPVLLGPPFR